MQIAIVGAGYTGGEADQLRRDMAAWRKNGQARAAPRAAARRASRSSGIAREFGERLYQQIQGFGEYGFPESHAASFALLVYASSWLKVHHPAAFAAALINSQPMGFYRPSTIVKDAERHGVEARLPAWCGATGTPRWSRRWARPGAAARLQVDPRDGPRGGRRDREGPRR